MASTYSPLLRYELIGSGEQAGVWGNTTNVNLGSLVEQSIAGVTTISATSLGGTTYTLTALNGAPDEARSMVLNFTGSAGSAFTVVVPTSQKLYVVRNNTGQTINFKTAAQVTPYAVDTANSTMIFCDGTNVLAGIAAPGVGTLLVSGGGTGATTFSAGFIKSPGGTTALTSSSTVSLTSEVSGTLPVASGGTGVTTFLTGGIVKSSGGTGALTASAVNLASGDVTNILTADKGGTGVGSPTAGRLLLGNGASAMSLLGGTGTGNFVAWNGTSWAEATLLGTTKGGTGLSSFISGGAVYANSTSTLTTGTLPATSGGTGVSSYTKGDILYAQDASTLVKLPIGSSGQVLSVSVSGIPTWGSTAAGVTSFSAGTTGFQPNIATGGAVTLSGTLNVANGGTGATTLASNALLVGAGTSTVATLAPGAANTVVKSNGTTWTAANISATDITSGTLPVARGGTNTTTLSANGALYADGVGTTVLSGTLPVASGGTGATSLTANGALYANGAGTAVLSGTLPVASGGTGSTTLAGAGIVLTTGAQNIGGAKNFTDTNTFSAANTFTAANTFSGANTFGNSTGQTFLASTTTTQDGIVVRGRAGGANNYRVTVEPSTLVGSYTAQLPPAPNLSTTELLITGTTGAAGTTEQTISGKKVFLASSTATQDGVIVTGRAGGTSSYRATIAPTTLTGDRTFTLPDITGTAVVTEGAQTINGTKTFAGGLTSSAYNYSQYTSTFEQTDGTGKRIELSTANSASTSSSKLIIGSGTGTGGTYSGVIVSTLTVNPSTNNSFDLGTGSIGWKNIYSNNTLNVISDQRQKTDVQDAALGLSFIKALRPVSYRMVVGSQEPDGGVDANGLPTVTPKPGVRTHYGLIAQEVKAAVDAANAGDFAGWLMADKNDPNSAQMLRYGEFISPLIKAVQELSAKVEALEARVTELGG